MRSKRRDVTSVKIVHTTRANRVNARKYDVTHVFSLSFSFSFFYFLVFHSYYLFTLLFLTLRWFHPLIIFFIHFFLFLFFFSWHLTLWFLQCILILFCLSPFSYWQYIPSLFQLCNTICIVHTLSRGGLLWFRGSELGARTWPSIYQPHIWTL